MKIIYLSLLTMFFFGCISQPKATIGLEEGKEMDTIDGDEPKRNAAVFS